jgi:RNA polymerase sigma-70 factor (ECF subfamily)
VEGLAAAVRRSLALDEAPLEAWMRERFAILRNALAQWTRDPALGDELAGRIVTAAYEALECGREIRIELAWMAAVARNRRAETERAMRDSPTHDLDDRPGTEPDPLQELAAEDIRECVRAAIDTLPEGYRIALNARLLDGCSLAETATRLGLGLEGTRSKVRRGRGMLRGALSRLLPQAITDACLRRRTESRKKKRMKP